MKTKRWVVGSVLAAFFLALGFGCGGGEEEMEDVIVPDFDNKADTASKRVVIKGSIAFGEVKSSAFDTSKYHGYTFVGAKDASIGITLLGNKAQKTDTVVLVYGPKAGPSWVGKPIAQDDNSAGNKFSMLSGFKLPANGEYLVIASCRNSYYKNKTYNLTLTCESGNCELQEETCGDGTCKAPDEDCATCFQDCGKCPADCGNGTCTSPEDCKTCPADCGTCPVADAEWTVLVYLSSDTHDDGGIPSSLDEMTQKILQNNELVNMLFLEDPPEGPNTMLYKVTMRKKQVVKDFGELHMGRPETLTDVIKYVRENYPSKRFFLDLIGHTSSAIAAFMPDYYPASESWEKERFMYWEVRKAIQDSGAAPVDVLALSGCGTGDLELAARMSDVAKYVVGLQEYNMGYTDVRWADSLTKNPTKTAKSLASLVAQGIFKKGYYEQKTSGATGAYDSSKIAAVKTALTELSATLNAKVSTKKAEFVAARKNVQESLSYSFEVDAYHLAQLLIDGTTDADISAKATAFQNALISMLVDGGVPNCADPEEHANAYGVNIVFVTQATTNSRILGPASLTDGTISAYPASEKSFYAETGWAEFVTTMFDIIE